MIGPDTSVESTYELLKVADTVLVMMVHPGFAGQGYLSFVEDKIDKLLELKAHCGFEIVLDGACSYEVIKRYYAIIRCTSVFAVVFRLINSMSCMPIPKFRTKFPSITSRW